MPTGTPVRDDARHGRGVDVDEDLRGLALMIGQLAGRIVERGAVGQHAAFTAFGAMLVDQTDQRQFFRMSGLRACEDLARIGQRVGQRRAPGRDLVDASLRIGVDRRSLQFERVDRGLGALQFRRRRFEPDPHARGGRIEQVDRLVGKLAGGNIAARQLHGGDQRFVADVHVVILRVALLQAAQHQTRGIVVGFVDLDELKAAFERGVAFEEFLVFRPGGGGDRPQLAACERRLEQVGRIGAARRVARADQGMRFVDKEQNRNGRGLNLVDDLFQSLLELALHAGAGLQQAQIERQDAHVADHVRHAALGDAQRQAFDQRRLAHAGLADEDRVVLAPSREHVDHLADFAIAAEHRVDGAGTGLFGQIGREAREGVAVGGAMRDWCRREGGGGRGLRRFGG